MDKVQMAIYIYIYKFLILIVKVMTVVTNVGWDYKPHYTVRNKN